MANSGGYRFPNYDRTISVIDLENFQVCNTIDVAINLHRMELDRYGRIYVSSRGDYYDVAADVYVIDTNTDKVIGNLELAASEMYLCGDSLYVTSVEWSYITGSNTISYALYDVKRQEIVSRNFTREIYVADATDYVTPGYLYCFTPDGKKKWKVRTGDIPAHFAFTTKTFY